MKDAIASRAKALTQRFAPLSTLPIDFHHEAVSYVFIYFTGSMWKAELMIDPIYSADVPSGWLKLIEELNERILPTISPYAKISGYYPIVIGSGVNTDTMPFACLTLGEDIPDMSSNTEAIDVQLLHGLAELPVLMTQIGLDPQDILGALQDESFAILAYLCQLVLLGLAPVKLLQEQIVFPNVVDDGYARLNFVATVTMQDCDGFLKLINETFFGNLYQGYQYLAGTYPMSKQDALECQHRTLTLGSKTCNADEWFEACAVAKRYYILELLNAIGIRA